MSWRDEFQTAAIALLVQKGTLVIKHAEDEWGFSYGWEDYEAMRHVQPTRVRVGGDHITGFTYETGPAPCRFVRARDVREDHWSEFLDTFQGNRDVTGIACTVDCACGELTGRRLRFNGRIHELLQDLLQFTEDQEFDLTTTNEED